MRIRISFLLNSLLKSLVNVSCSTAHTSVSLLGARQYAARHDRNCAHPHIDDSSESLALWHVYWAVQLALSAPLNTVRNHPANLRFKVSRSCNLFSVLKVHH